MIIPGVPQSRWGAWPLRGAPSAVAASGVITTFTLANYDASEASPVYHQKGQAFAPGDVPTGSTVLVRRADTQAEVICYLDGPASWPDGSLAYAGLHIIDDTDIAAESERAYEILAVSGSRTPTASGENPWTEVSGHCDLKIALTDMTASTGTAPPTSATASLNTDAATSTRRRIYMDAPRCISVGVWAMFPSDGWLKANHKPVIWYDDEGAIAGVQYEAEVAQDWIVDDPLETGQANARRQYDAELLDDATSLEVFYRDDSSNPIQHPGRCAWWVGQKTGANAGRPFWVAGTKTQPTLYEKVDRDYLIESHLISPFDFSVIRDLEITSFDYYPGERFGYNQGIDSTGGSAGRGSITEFCVRRLRSQTAAQDRAYRVAALVGLHVPNHRIRSHLTSTGISDVTNRLIPSQKKIGLSNAADYTTTAFTDLGDRHRYCLDDRSSIDTLTRSDPHTPNNWGNVSWTPSINNSHTPMFGFFPSMLYGRRIFREMTQDHGAAGVYRVLHAHACFLGEAIDGRSGWTDLRYSPCAADTQARGYAWYANVIANAYFVAEDGSDEQELFLDYVEANAAWQNKRIEFIAAQSSDAQYERRILFGRQHLPHEQPFQYSFIAACYSRAYWLTRRSDMRSVAVFAAGFLDRAMASDYPLIIQNTGVPWLYKEGAYDAATNDFVVPTGWCNYPPNDGVTLNGTDNTINITNFGASGLPTAWATRTRFTEGDQVYLWHTTQPTGLSNGQLYYLVNVTNNYTAQLSLTEDGEAIDFTGDKTQVSFHHLPQVLFELTDLTTEGLQLTPPASGDGNYYMSRFGLCEAWALQPSEDDSYDLDNMRMVAETINSTIDYSATTVSTWICKMLDV